jgi:hypothetical protein
MIPIERLKELAKYGAEYKVADGIAGYRELPRFEVIDMAQEIIDKREQLRWRDGRKGWPTEDGDYLVLLKVENMQTVVEFNVNHGWIMYGYDITHWMPLPPIPE